MLFYYIWLNKSHQPYATTYAVNGIQIAFTNELAKGLPKPVIQLEFQLNVPCLLH